MESEIWSGMGNLLDKCLREGDAKACLLLFALHSHIKDDICIDYYGRNRPWFPTEEIAIRMGRRCPADYMLKTSRWQPNIVIK